MAIMSRRKKAIAQRWDSISSQKEKENQIIKKKEDEILSEEEHEKRLEILRNLGLLK